MRQIQISDVAVARDRKPALDRPKALATMLAKRVEQTYDSDRPLVICSDRNALADAAHDAFYEHRPLVLSPDAVWFCLAQGFALHVSQNVEKLRGRFVRHQGQLELVVVRNDFALGQRNPWPEAFAAFSAQVAGHVGKVHDLVAARFSTTGPAERAAYDVVVMDAFQGYFKYTLVCGCGIPSVTLLGTSADWRSVRDRAAALGEYGLERWTRALLPVLDRIVASAEGAGERDFWRSFFRYETQSGPAILTGWIHVLFPYLKEEGKIVENHYLHAWEQNHSAAEKGKRRSLLDFVQGRAPGPPINSLPPALCSAPVKIVDPRKETKVRFIGGMLGVVEDPATLALAPEFGWAVVYD